VPVAVTDIVVLLPLHTVVLEGWEVTTGASFIVKVPAFDVTGGEHVPESTHLYRYPFIPELAPKMVRVEVVAPE
jgi:hypothetical protein